MGNLSQEQARQLFDSMNFSLVIFAFIVLIVRIVFVVLLFVLVIKAIKYLSNKNNNSCATCVYRQQYKNREK